MITREQLKVGETYSSVNNESAKRTVKFIGDLFVVYDIQGNETKEEGWSGVSYFLNNNNLIPKPKKRFWLWDVEFMGRVS